MIFQLDSYDQTRALDFETRMGAVNGQLSDLIASRVRFNDASKIAAERRRCFAIMSMKRSEPYLNHSKAVIMLSFTLLNVFSRTSGIMSLAQALHASHAASASSIPHATVTVFVAGNAADNAHSFYIDSYYKSYSLIDGVYDYSFYSRVRFALRLLCNCGALGCTRWRVANHT